MSRTKKKPIVTKLIPERRNNDKFEPLASQLFRSKIFFYSPSSYSTPKSLWMNITTLMMLVSEVLGPKRNLLSQIQVTDLRNGLMSEIPRENMASNCVTF